MAQTALPVLSAYVFEWSEGPDDGYGVMSLHWTKIGAHKARMLHARMRWQEERDRSLVWGKISGLDPLHFGAGRVREVGVML